MVYSLAVEFMLRIVTCGLWHDGTVEEQSATSLLQYREGNITKHRKLLGYGSFRDIYDKQG